MPLFKSKGSNGTGVPKSSATPSPQPSPSLIPGFPSGISLASIPSIATPSQKQPPQSPSQFPPQPQQQQQQVNNETDIHRSRSMSQRFKNLFIHEDESSTPSRSVSRVQSTSSLLKKSGTNSHQSLQQLVPHNPPLPIPDRGQGIKSHFVTPQNSEDTHQLDIDQVLEDSSISSISPPPLTGSNKPRMRSKTVSVSSNLYHHNHSPNSTSNSSPQPTRENNSSNSVNFLPNLKHSKTINYSSAHLHNQRDRVIKLKSGRTSLYDYGRAHEHDYTKYKTHVIKTNNGLFGWMKRKEEDDDKFSSIEQSISLLPDKYSRELTVLKNDPKNVIWNYDDDDDPQELIIDDHNESPLLSIPDNYVNAQSDDELDKIREKHGIEDPIKSLQIQRRKSISDAFKMDHRESGDISYSEEEEEEEEDEDEDDDDFDDVIDNMMIEPIIGTEQVYLIDTVMDKIVHPEKFIKSIDSRKSNGKYKLTLEQKYGAIAGVIGRGSYGTVCIAKKEIPNREPVFFAIKQLRRREKESLKHFGTRVASEFMISSSLTHQAIINVYDLMFDPVTKIYSQVMEFIPCGDLYSLIYHTKGLDIVECDCFFKQILNAVTYLHSVGISHNDLKVENLLLTKKGQLKIIDFGTSAVFRTQWESDIQLSKGACGSERYIAPEQFIESTEYDPRLGDVWALGIIYLVMYHGHYSWESAKKSDDGYKQFIDQRAQYDYTQRTSSLPHQFLCIRKPTYGPIESIKGSILNSWIQCGGEVVPKGCDCDSCVDRALSPTNIIGVGGVSSLSKNLQQQQQQQQKPSTDNLQSKAKQSILKKNGSNVTPESINDSRRYVLYNILNPDPQYRMRTYQIWQSEWIKETRVCDAGRGFALNLNSWNAHKMEYYSNN